MAQVDFGPATGNAELFLGTPPTAGIEVHVPAGVNPLAPCYAAYIDPNTAYSGTVINKVVVGIQVTIPA